MHLIALSRESDGYGAETSLYRITQGLARRGHAVTLLYHKPGCLVEQYRSFCAHTAQIRTLPVYGAAALARALPDFLSDIARLPNRRYDLVYSNQYSFMFFACAVSLLKRIPLVCHHRDEAPEKISFMFPIAFRRASSNLFVSQATREGWLRRKLVPQDRSEVLYNGVDTDRFRPADDIGALRKRYGLGPEERVILFAGRLTPQKGIETLLGAFSRIAREGLSARLWVVGEASSEETAYGERLRSWAHQAGLSDRVDFLGFKDRILPFYQVADLTVLPSVRHETFGRTIVESMACETPALASRIGGMPEILRGEFERHLFEPGDEEGLAALLAERLDWRLRDPLCGRRCREHVLKNFSLDRMVDGVEKALAAACR